MYTDPNLDCQIPRPWSTLAEGNRQNTVQSTIECRTYHIFFTYNGNTSFWMTSSTASFALLGCGRTSTGTVEPSRKMNSSGKPFSFYVRRERRPVYQWHRICEHQRTLTLR